MGRQGSALGAAALLGIVSLALLGAAVPDDSTPLTLEQAIALAMTANKDLTAARLGRGMAQARVDIAGQRPNPELRVELEAEAPKQAYTLGYPFEIGGKRRRRIDLSEAEAGSGEAEISRLEAQTRLSVRRAYGSLWAAQRRVETSNDLVDLAKRTRDAAQERFDAGDVPRLDLIQADLNLAQVQNDSSNAAGELNAARVELNTLLARAPDHPTTVLGSVDPPELPDETMALDLATRASVDLALIDGQIAEARARVKLARAERVPDLVLEGAVTRDAEPEFDTGWRAGLGLTLPVLNQHRGEVRLEESSLAQLESQREASLAKIQGAIHEAIVQASARREQYLRYRDLILPEAAEMEKLAEESYQEGQTSLVTMLQAFGMARDVRLKSVGSELDYQMALADLEMAVGAPLP